MTQTDPAPAWLHTCALAWRMLRRDARAGELHALLLALVLAVAAVTSVAFLSTRVAGALERDAARLLGADLVLESGAPIAAAFVDAAHARGLAAIRLWEFPSMVAAGEAVQLAAVKAVEPGYPLRGELRTALGPQSSDSPAMGIPARGTVWLDAALLARLAVNMHDRVQLGEASFRIARLISLEPDRGMQFVNLAPRVLLHADDLAATELTGPGSRISYLLHVAGEEAALRAYRDWLVPQLAPDQRLADLASGRPEVRRALDRAQRFLALVALLAVMMAGVAIAMAARRYVARHRDATAIMRCLGATQALIMRVLTLEFAGLALAGGALGCALGWLAHWGLLAVLAGLIDAVLPATRLAPVLQGLLAGCWLLLGFALPPVARLRHVPPARVLRRDAPGPAERRVVDWLAWFAVGLGLLVIFAWVAGEFKLGLLVCAGFVAALVVFAGLTTLALAGLTRLRERLPRLLGPTLRFALAGLIRRRAATLAQTCALAAGLSALVLLAIVRTDLLAGWQRSLPANTPNHFLINIQPDQRTAITERLAQAGLGETILYPMVRGRLAAINGRAVALEDYPRPRAKRLLARDFNLSWAERIPAWNRLIVGQPLNPAESEVSLEAELAATLALSVGDTLRFMVAGSAVDVRVSSIRQVDWDSMHANFFALLTPAALATFEQSWITSFYLPELAAEATPAALHTDFIPGLIRDFPNLTVFDVRALLAQVQRVLTQAASAVQLLFLFTLAAGAVVLAAALSASRDERQHEAALLRALGATRAQLARAQHLEMLATGLLAGLLAATAASVLAWLLATQVFDFAWRWPLWPWPLASALAMLCAWAAGALTLRGVLRTPPWVSLREG